MNKKSRYPKGVRGLAAYELSVEMSVDCLNMLNTVHAPADLVNQAQRAAISIPLNIAEGAGRRGRDRSYHFSIAYGSGRELVAALELIRGLGLADDTKINDMISLLDRVNRVVWAYAESDTDTGFGHLDGPAGLFRYIHENTGILIRADG